MDKPLARYRDDNDLDAMLKEQDRDGDPMMAFLQKKQSQKRAASGVKGKRPLQSRTVLFRTGKSPEHPINLLRGSRIKKGSSLRTNSTWQVDTHMVYIDTPPCNGTNSIKRPW